MCLCECDQTSFAFEKAAGVAGTEKTGGRKSRGFCQDYGGLHKGLEHREGMLGELTASGIPTPIATLNSIACDSKCGRKSGPWMPESEA